MRFGIYVHIPYCVQICPYCDFAKYEIGKVMPPEEYVKVLIDEIRSRSQDVPFRQTDTIYFGGGTPSLLEAPLILSILEALAKEGFVWSRNAEITVEINPGTIDQKKLDQYSAIGINRFSVGAQTFNERLLKIAGRKHSSDETVATLKLLKSSGANYSFDLLFALPTQTAAEVRADVRTALAFSPSHLSAYCLTVPENHPMARGRAIESEQVEMFDLIEQELCGAGIEKYEISNFAKPGSESRHNTLYWTDQPYWGLGVSSHSYFPRESRLDWKALAPFGFRFWNPAGLKTYVQQVSQLSQQHLQPQSQQPSRQVLPQPSQQPLRLSESFAFLRSLPSDQIEILQENESLTDFCHTSLRFVRGMTTDAARLKFSPRAMTLLFARLEALVQEGLLQPTIDGFSFTAQGRLVADIAFEKLTFLKGDLDP